MIAQSWLERERVKKSVLEKISFIVYIITRSAKSPRISIRLRTLIKYAYIAYILGEERFNVIKGLTSKIKPPRYLFNRDFYKAVEEVLARNFHICFETRRGDKRYAVITVKQPALAKVIG